MKGEVALRRRGFIDPQRATKFKIQPLILKEGLGRDRCPSGNSKIITASYGFRGRYLRLKENSAPEVFLPLRTARTVLPDPFWVVGPMLRT